MPHITEIETLSRLNVLVVDDHPIYRKGLRNLLAGSVRHIETAENGQIAVERLESFAFDVVLMDVEMPTMNGIEATRIISKRFPDTHVIALTMFAERPYIVSLHDAGVKGYLLKEADLPEIRKAMLAVFNHDHYYCHAASSILANLAMDRSKGEDRPVEETVTEREAVILQLLCQQLSADEIASRLSISANTVRRHKQNLFEKTHSKNLAGLVMYAVTNGIYIKR